MIYNINLLKIKKLSKKMKKIKFKIIHFLNTFSKFHKILYQQNLNFQKFYQIYHKKFFFSIHLKFL